MNRRRALYGLGTLPLGLLLLPFLALALQGAGHLGEALAAWDVALQSLLLAAGGTLLVLGAGLALAFLGVLGGVGRGLEGLLLLSFYIPPFVTGMGLLFTFQSLGWRLYGTEGILLAWTLHYAPMAYALLRPSLEPLLPLLRAARAHGVVGARRLRVLLPPLLPGLLSTGGLVYLALLGNFGVPAVLGLPERVYTLPTLAYARLTSPLSQDPLGEAAALGLVLGLLALPALALRPRPLLEAAPEAAPPPRPLFRLGFALYALLALALTAWGLLREAFLNPYTGALEPAFGAALALPLVGKGLGNSLLLALGAASLLLLLALALRPFPGALARARALLDLHYTLPGTLLGLGLILLLAPTPLYATPWLLLLAYLLHFASLALRALEAGVRVEPGVAAARVHGLPFLEAWLRVGYPLLLPQARGAFFLVFPLALSEVTLSALLYAPGAETVGVAVLGALNGGLYREAAAVGLLLALLSTVALLTPGGRRW
ncbi:ABC transporter permease family protein [Thermus thermophilus]|uniref:ABC transporter permease n=1 Tax=Thermus thermophilus TaxID=274 RepID=UPI001FCDB245|nr:ABC transporter permease [Thermus thermophilus]